MKCWHTRTKLENNLKGCLSPQNFRLRRSNSKGSNIIISFVVQNFVDFARQFSVLLSKSGEDADVALEKSIFHWLFALMWCLTWWLFALKKTATRMFSTKVHLVWQTKKVLLIEILRFWGMLSDNFPISGSGQLFRSMDLLRKVYFTTYFSQKNFHANLFHHCSAVWPSIFDNWGSWIINYRITTIFDPPIVKNGGPDKRSSDGKGLGDNFFWGEVVK